MFKMISKFAASPWSGYILIALVLAGAGAAYWFWSELKEFGGLTERSAQQAEEIEEQDRKLADLKTQIAARQIVLKQQQSQTASLRRQAENTRQTIQEALRDAPQDYINCRDYVVPERLRFGPSRQGDGSKP